MSTLQKIGYVRAKTGAPVTDCEIACNYAGWNVELAIEFIHETKKRKGDPRREMESLRAARETLTKRKNENKNQTDQD